MPVDNECGIAANQGDLGTMTGAAGARPQSATTTAQTYFVAAPTSLTAMQAIPDIITVELWDGYGASARPRSRAWLFVLIGVLIVGGIMALAVLAPHPPR